jgi:hypothetical protein
MGSDRRNPKEFKENYETYWYLEYIQDDESINWSYDSSVPKSFRAMKHNDNLARFAYLQSFSMNNTSSALFETRANIEFKKDDKILDNLNVDDDGNYLNFSRIDTVDIKYDSSMGRANRRLSRRKDIINFLGIG